eukprot:gene6926-2639_t
MHLAASCNPEITRLMMKNAGRQTGKTLGIRVKLNFP